MTAEIAGLYKDLDKSRLRIIRPSKPIFLCGGFISKPKKPRPVSLREYIYRNFKTAHPTDGQFVLAELANQLYRDTSYPDLITFEEDIARIASIILVVAESPGSLAELGAFASNGIIRKRLRIILKEQHANEESFIRYGPVQRIKRDSEDNVAIYPWRTNKDGNLILTSAQPHKKAIIDFIDGQLSSVPKSELFSKLEDAAEFFIVLWIIHVSFAITHAQIYAVIRDIGLDLQERDIKNIIYCLRMVNWVGTYSYSSRDYLYTLHDLDPFDYAFSEGVADTDSARRTAAIPNAIHKGAALPSHVRRIVAQARATI